MLDRGDGQRWRGSLVAIAGALAVLALAACGEDGDEGQAGAQDGTAGAEKTVASAERRLDTLARGTQRKPPSDGPPAERDKKVTVVSCGQSIESCSFSAGAARAAGEEIGWDMNLIDGKANPVVFQNAVRQATVDDADGIILYGIDCEDTRGALREARDAGIEVVAFDSFDCDDPHVGGKPLFSARIQSEFPDHAANTVAWGNDKAGWIVAETNGEAKVVEVRQIGALTTDYIHEGFEEGIAGCGTCEIVDTVEVTFEDVGAGTVADKVSRVLLQNPDANAVHVPYDGLMVLGVGTAIEQSGRSKELAVMGGEGFKSNLDIIRSDGAQDAAMAFQQEWIAWATVDTLNRVFAGETEFPDQGFGWQLVERGRNLPSDGGYEAPLNFKSAYRSIWDG